MKKSRKSVLIAITVFFIIAIITGVFFIVKPFDKTSNITITNIEEKDISFYKLKKEDKFGIIDKNGKVIIEPQYYDIVIPNPKKDLFICTDSADYNKRVWKAINSENVQKLTEFESVEAIAINPLSSIVPFEKETLKYKDGNLYGLITLDGKKLLPAEYEEITNIDYKEGYLKVKKEGLYGVVNILGKTIIKPQYFDINSDGYYSDKNKYENSGFILQLKTDEGYKFGYADNKGKVLFECNYNEIYRITENLDEKTSYLISSLNGKYGLIRDDKPILDNQFDSIEYDNNTNLIVVDKSNKQGVYNLQGENIIPIEYDSINIGGDYINATKDNNREVFGTDGNRIQTTFANHQKVSNDYYIIIDENNNYNIADSSNHLLLQQQYLYIEYYNNDLFIVTQGTNSGIINSNGNVVVPIKYNSLQRIENKNLIIATTAQNNKVDLINGEGKISEGIDNGIVDIHDNYIKIYSENNMKYFDMNGNEIKYKDIFPNNKLYAENKNGKWGFVDKSGNTVVDYIYDMVTEQNGDVAGIKKDGLWGVVDSSGNVILKPVYKLNWNNIVFLSTYYEQNGQIGDKVYSSDIYQ